MRFCSLSKPGHGIKRNAFSLPELLVIIVILGVIGAVGIQGFFFLVRRARVQSVALEVAGWLENVRNAAADAVDQDDGLGGCEVEFFPGAAMVAGATPSRLASIVNRQACDVPEADLFIPQAVQQDSVAVAIAGPDEIIFTPRGLWTDAAGNPYPQADADGNLGADYVISITLNNGGPLRCVRLSPVLGSVEIGRPANSAGSECSEWQLL